MDDTQLRDFNFITKVLSDFIKNNKIEGGEYTEAFSAALKAFIQANSMKGTKDLIELSHYLNQHDDASIKLPCGSIHCIRCYYELVKEGFYKAGTTQCTCLQNIAPIGRKKIIDNFKRIENLVSVCVVCEVRKDISYFLLRKVHNCKICSECFMNNFEYDKRTNKCLVCDEEFTEEGDRLIRDVIETKMDPNEVKKMYSSECRECKKKSDSRAFIQICAENKCTVCKECANLKSKNNVESCVCGDRLSILG